MKNEAMFEAIDGACGVELDPERSLAVVWHGGATFNVYALPSWEAASCFTHYGNDNGDPLDPQGARAAMRDYIQEAMAEDLEDC